MPVRRSPKRKVRSRFSAKTADRHILYQLAVQSPEDDLDFLARLYKRLQGRTALRLREDFCGTALLCATWVKRSSKHVAEGFDLDPDTLAWGTVHNLEPLGQAASRVTLHMKDVRAASHVAPDIRIAQNFSYSIFKRRDELLEYFKAARKSLAKHGIFAIDIYGGYEATAEMEETRRVEGGFTYVWDQARYLPGTGDYRCHIHFRFRDGTEMKKAFTYDWRFWSMPEIKDLLREAGFRHVDSFFEQSDDDDDGNGVFVRDDSGKTAEDCAGWIAYVIARN